jgi:hypothetical protein
MNAAKVAKGKNAAHHQQSFYDVDEDDDDFAGRGAATVGRAARGLAQHFSVILPKNFKRMDSPCNQSPTPGVAATRELRQPS